MASVLGLRGTGDFGVDERPKNFREMILWSNPNGSAPLTALLSKARSESTNDPEFAWFEEEQNGLQLKTVTAAAAGDTSLTVTSNVTDAGDVVAGDIFVVGGLQGQTYGNEIVIATNQGDPLSGIIQIQRGATGSAAAAIPAGTILSKLGTAFAEGTRAPESAMRNPTKFYNLCQIFKTTYAETETAVKTHYRTGDVLKNDKKRKMFDHSVSMEMQFLFGRRFEANGVNGKPIRFTGGIRWFLSEYAPDMVTDFAGTTITEQSFTDALYRVFDYNFGGAGNERLVLAGNGFLNSLNRLANSQARTRCNFDQIVKVYGMDLQRWIMPQGTIYVKTHPLFNTSEAFINDAAVLDVSSIKYRFLRDTVFKDDIQHNDEDIRRGQWLTEAGLEFEHAKGHAWLSNFVV